MEKLVVFLLATLGLASAVDWDVVTPLDEFVNRPDPYYAFYEVERIDQPEYTLHVLNMTSLMWFDETWSMEPLWWHYLNIFVPKAPLIHDAAYIHIGNGNHGDENPDIDSNWMQRTADFAVNVGAVAGYLRTVPFQPIRFVDEYGNVTLPKVEDFIIGYTWKIYIEDPSPEPDPDVVVLLPMVKAAKHAVDTMKDFVAAEYTGYNLTRFFPTGYSKRGWTTWLLGCVDRRIFAMAPTVFDLLNFQMNLEHHYRALGGWSWAFTPYWMEDVSKYLYHPRLPELASFIDPLAFNERLTMPKLLIAAADDEFFPPDGTHYFWEDLTPPKYFQLWENDQHSLGDHLDERDHNIQAFFLATYRGETLPSITWTRSEDATTGTIRVQTSPSVLSISAWDTNTTAATCEADRNNTCRRDFRIQALNGPTNITWVPTDVNQVGVDEYEVTLNKRDDFGYRAFFIEMYFEGPANYQFRFTTEVNIIPDTFPYPKCETEEECKGRLI